MTGSSQLKEVATLAGGCFWCLEAVYDQLRGVEDVVSGYSGGRRPNPTYEQVCTGATGHAEVVQVTFDPQVISYRDILGVFFDIHDPTTLNRQGADVGTQYRSAIFHHSPEQKAAAEAVVGELNSAGLWPGPIVTRRYGPIDGHAYGHLAKCQAQLRLYHQTRDERLLEPTRRLTDLLTQRDGMVISGAVSEQECWHDTQNGTCWLGETCASVYLGNHLRSRFDRASAGQHGPRA